MTENTAIEGSFDRLFEREGPWVYAQILRIVDDPKRAERLVEEVFRRAWRNPRLVSAGWKHAPVWLRVTGRKVAVESLQPGGFPSHSLAESCAADVRLHGQAELPRVARAVAALLPHEREMFELSYFEGLSHSEIAAMTGRSLGTVKTWVRAARMRIERVAPSDRMLNDARGTLAVSVSSPPM